jgi:hypothetical protein
LDKSKACLIVVSSLDMVRAFRVERPTTPDAVSPFQAFFLKALAKRLIIFS